MEKTSKELLKEFVKSGNSVKGSFPDKQFKCLLDSDYLDRVLEQTVCS